MSIRKLITRLFCHIAICDGCRTVFDDSNGDGHFPSADEALQFVTQHAGWNLSEYGHLTCPRCDAYFFCVHHGHDWTDWAPCPCAGYIPGHHTNGCPLRRTCQRCDEIQTTAPTLPPRADESTTNGY